MSVQTLATTIAGIVKETKDKSGMAMLGVYSGGMVTLEVGTFPAVKAVPVNVYDGKMVWCLVNATKTSAVIVGD